MSVIAKLIGLATMGSTVSNAYLMKRLFSRIIIAVVLAVVTSLMVVLLVAAGLYGLYMGLVHFGCAPMDAMIMVCGLLLLITLVLISLTLKHMRCLREGLNEVLSPQIPVVSDFHAIISAFVDGFMSKPEND